MADQEAGNIALNNILDEFWQVVFNTYGTYCDSWQGILEWGKSLKNLPETQENKRKEILEKIREAAKTDPKFEDLLKNITDTGIPVIDSFSYCRYVPVSIQDKIRDRVLPQFSYEDMLDRNKMDGINHRHIGNMCVVTIYQYWEDNYRGKLAEVLGLEHKNCIFVDIFGDIAALRNSIIHNSGNADRRIPQKSSKAWFEKGEPIIIDRFKFENLIIDEIYAFVEEFRINPHKFIQAWKKRKKKKKC